MSLTILRHPDPVLRKIAAPIPEVTDEIRELAAAMAETMYRAEGIGLAAPQIGRSIRLITVDVTGPERREGLLTLINPELTPLPEAGYVEGEEGCLSVEDYRAKVRRSALDANGAPVRLEAEGLLAVCLQHEVDHLEGKLFIDHLSRLKRSMYEARLRKRLRNNA